jgi:hypothetical protein
VQPGGVLELGVAMRWNGRHDRVGV